MWVQKGNGAERQRSRREERRERATGQAYLIHIVAHEILDLHARLNLRALRALGRAIDSTGGAATCEFFSQKSLLIQSLGTANIRGQ